MTHGVNSKAGRFDAIVVGGGHNGLVCAAYLARANRRVLVLEARSVLGGPCGNIEFLPGYRSAITNSPGSFEPRILVELELERFGLRFLTTDPTVVHAFPGRPFIGWRDPARVAAQLDDFVPGEAARYQALIARLEDLGQNLGVSLFSPHRSLADVARRVPRQHERLFEQVMFGSLRQLLDEALRSEQAKAILGMVALNATLAPPSAPGSAVGLLMRPISRASTPARGSDDPRNVPLRGSTGLPLGGMAAIIDAMAASLRAHGGTIMTDTTVAQILHRYGRASGVVTTAGDVYEAPVVVSAINPWRLFADLLDDDAVPAEMRREITAVPMRGSAFKIALALDGIPAFADLPSDVDPVLVAGRQFRIADSLNYIESSVADGLAGRWSRDPIMWGFMPSVISPDLVPPGRHLLSVNVWHAPYSLRDGDWESETERFGQHCIDVMSRVLPDLRRHLLGARFMGPRELERELGMVGSNITHGDMLPYALFGPRPHPDADDYRTPLPGLYLSGGGTWPGGYVTGVPGYNASQAVLQDQPLTTTT